MSRTLAPPRTARAERSTKPLWTGLRRPRALWGHALFWLLVLVYYASLFGAEGERFTTSLIFVLLLLPNTAATSYLLIHLLVPHYLLKQRYAQFALYLAYLVVGSLYVQLVTVLILFVVVAEYHLSRLDPATFDVVGVLAGMYVVVFLVATANLVERWFHAQAANRQLAEARTRVELELKEAQLALLKSQIRPHFLFNTLNNLYGLTLAKSDRAPEAVLHLSDMLDYALYRGEARTVPLAEELDFLRNYVELQRLRYSDRVAIRFEAGVPEDDLRIAPLLLIPLVENGFKHGVSRSGAGAWIEVHAEVGDGWLVFRVDNSMPDAEPADASHEGVGLQNVAQRLELLYPNAHTLTTGVDGGVYHASLRVRLKHTGGDLSAIRSVKH